MRLLRHVRISVLGALAIATCIPRLSCQEGSCQRRIIPVAFRDAQNLPIQSISTVDLEGKIHGKALNILSLSPDPRPHRLVLILDMSGSMGQVGGGTPPWHLEVVLARHFFMVNREKSQFALLIFNDKVKELIDFSRGNSAVADTLERIGDRQFVRKELKGKTALHDAILQGLELLDHPGSADALYVLTDAGDNSSIHSRSDVMRRLALTSVRLFAILMEGDMGYRNRTPEETSGPGELSEIAEKSGGQILTVAEGRGDKVALSANINGKTKTQDTLIRLYQTILQNNLLEIELPFSISKDERWELRLSDSARHKWKGAQITYPKVLVSCSSEALGPSH